MPDIGIAQSSPSQSPYVTHEHGSKQTKQIILVSQVFTFDKSQRHRLLFFSAKTNYHLFNLWPSLPPDVSTDVTPSRSCFFFNLSSPRLSLEREVMEERSEEEEVEEVEGV